MKHGFSEGPVPCVQGVTKQRTNATSVFLPVVVSPGETLGLGTWQR